MVEGSLYTTVARLSKELTDGDWWVRTKAAESLGEFGADAKEAVPALAMALRDENRYVRFAVVTALGKIGPDAKEAIPALIERFEEKNDNIKKAAREALTRIGKIAIPDLIKFLGKREYDIHATAYTALVDLHSVALPDLIDALSQYKNNEEILRWVIRILGDLGQYATEAVSVLAPLLKERRFFYPTIEALTKIGGPAVSYIAQELKNEEVGLRKEASKALLKLGAEAQKAVPALIEALEDEEIQSTVAQALTQIGPEAKDAIPELARQLRKGPRRGLWELAKALGAIGKSAIPVLLELLREDDSHLRGAAAEALEQMGPDAVSTVTSLIECLDDQEEFVRRKAIEALGAIGVEARAAVPALLKRIGKEGQELAGPLANALSKIGVDESAIPALITALRLEQERYSNPFIPVLASIGENALPSLRALLKEPDHNIRTQALKVLELMGATAKEATPDIISLLQEELSKSEWRIYSDAIRTLGEIGVEMKIVFPFYVEAYKKAEAYHIRREVVEAFLKNSQAELETLLPMFLQSIGGENKKIREQFDEIIEHLVATEKLSEPDWTGREEKRQALQKIALQAHEILRSREMPVLPSLQEAVLQEDVEDASTEPTQLDPSLVRFDTHTMSLDLVLSRIRHQEMELRPAYQRKVVWTDVMQSRLIESMMLKVPLPAFYIDADREDNWLVFDGQQRLTSMKRFVVEKDLKLQGLEFFMQYQGASFDDLPRHLQRRILETQLTIYTIEQGTPLALKFNIFKRINTGGIPLSPQEIRHALYQGQSTEFLTKLFESPEFLVATGYKFFDKRTTAQEVVLRVLAFILIPYNQYDSDNFDGFLNETMERLNQMSPEELAKLDSQFRRGMTAARTVWGTAAFRIRKTNQEDPRKWPMSKSLIEVWTTFLGLLEDNKLGQFFKKRDQIQKKFDTLMQDREFVASLTRGTGNQQSVRTRFKAVEHLLQEELGEIF